MFFSGHLNICVCQECSFLAISISVSMMVMFFSGNLNIFVSVRDVRLLPSRSLCLWQGCSFLAILVSVSMMGMFVSGHLDLCVYDGDVHLWLSRSLCLWRSCSFLAISISFSLLGCLFLAMIYFLTDVERLFEIHWEWHFSIFHFCQRSLDPSYLEFAVLEVIVWTNQWNIQVSSSGKSRYDF